MPVECVPNAKTYAGSEYSRRIDRVIVLAAFKTVIEWAKSQDVFSQGILFGMKI